MPEDDAFDRVDSKDSRGATLGRWAAKSLFSPSGAGPGPWTSLPRVPTPPGPCRWRDGKFEVEEERDLVVRLGDGFEFEFEGAWEESRGRSREELGGLLVSSE